MTTVAQVIAETCRLRLMRGLEERLYGCGYGRIAGVDEAGRGCLAGPVVAAAVVVEPGNTLPGVDDSKSLSPAQRRQLAALIRRSHPMAAVAAVEAPEIDRMNILEATRCAMKTALATLPSPPEIALIDAVPLTGTPCPTLPVIRGDQISYAIACASILAKVERDRIMVELDRTYPHYGFASHKGYGAPRHRQALRDFGPCAIHRLTFRSVLPAADAGGR